MTYNPNIPLATDNISVSQGQLLTNFGQANTIFDNDHYAFNDAPSGGANRGYHRQVYFPIASAANPSLGGFAGVFFAKNDPNDTSTRSQLYYRNIVETNQITNRFFNEATPGYVMVNGNLIFMWGIADVSVLGKTDVTFPSIDHYVGAPVGFPNAILNVTFSVQASSAANAPDCCIDTTTPPSATGFTIRIATTLANSKAYWFAVGY